MRKSCHLLFVGIVSGVFLAGCGGDGGGSSGTTPAPAPSLSVSVSPTTITLGQTATVTWASTGASSCTASGAWSGSIGLTGSKAETPTTAGTATYTVSCSTSGGAYGGSSSLSKSATLTVSGPTNTSAIFSLTSLVADVAGGTAISTDRHLVNPWGLSIPPGNFAAWVANNGSQTSTLYDGNGKAQPASSPLIVTFAAGAGNVAFDPTGIVFNASATDFKVGSGATAAASPFIFSGEGGMIAGWSPSVNATAGITMYADTTGAVYKGLAIAQNNGQMFLYATDFHNGKVDVFNTTFAKQATSASAFTFQDPAIPAGYAPFGIQALANGTGGATQIYVTYAQQQTPDDHDNVNGAGLGYVDIYDTNGQLVKALISKGSLNAPWGIALAPSDFGAFSDKLLVGNFGDGKINAFDPATGTSAGTVSDSNGAPIASPGLWGIAFGNDADNQPHNTLFIAAGPNDEADGLYGRIDLGATPPTLNGAPVVKLTAPAGSLKGSVTLSATAQNSVGIAQVQFFASSQSIGTATTSPYSVSWDTTKVANGSVSLTAKATDVDGNVGTSTAVAVTVANQTASTVTLSQLQAQVFTPICSGCHSGLGSSLPGVQNLTAGHTFSNVVNVASIEQPSLVRIKPNDPANSYMIRKIQGAAGISGSRMPLGCGSASDPCLDAATINQFIEWVNAGALNN